MATNRKRDFFKRFRSSGPEPIQPSQTSPLPQALPVKGNGTSTGNAPSSTTAASTGPSVVPPQCNSTGLAAALISPATPPIVVASHLAPSTDRQENTAFKIAFEKYLTQLSDGEKAAFLASSAQSLTANDIIKRAEECGQNFAASSPFWGEKAGKLERFLQLLKTSVNIGKGVSQANATADLVLGAAQSIIDIALKFVSFFTKLTEMLCRFGDFLEVLALYDKPTTDQTVLQKTLAAVYGDLLQFCRNARSVYVKMDGQQRRFIPMQVFWRQQWNPFENEFGDIEKRFLGHLELLQHASSATTLKTLDFLQELLESQDRRRKAKEQISQKEEFLNWLSNDANEMKHRERRETHHPGTGKWLVEDLKFQKWFTSTHSSVLWCYGGPGIGKSLLASTVVEYVLHEKACRDGIGLNASMGVAFMYFDYRQKDIHTLDQFVCALLKQLCRDKINIPLALLEAKQKARPKGDSEDFRLVARDYDEVIIIADALDECDAHERSRMIGFLIRMSRELSNVKIFISSRKESDMAEAFKTAEAPVIEISAQSVAGDIEDYVRHEIQDLRKGRENGRKLYIKSDSLEAEVIQTLTEKADGMFLWVQLQIESLCRISKMQNDDKVRRALSTLPKGLDETYIRIWEKIMDKEPDERDVALRILQWVFYSKRPLATEELQRVLATQECQSSNDVDRSNVELISKDGILAACENLVVEVGEYSATDSAVCHLLRPVHYSTQEFFTRSEASPTEPSSIRFLLNSSNAHTALAMACLSNVDEVFCSPAPNSLRMFFDGHKSLREPLVDVFTRASDDIARLFISWFPTVEYVGQHKRYAYRRFAWYAAMSFDYHILHAGHLSDRLKIMLNHLFSGPSQGIQALFYIRSIGPDKERLPHVPSKSFISLQSQIPATTQGLFYTTLLSAIDELDGQFGAADLTTVAWFYALKTNSDLAVKEMIIRGYDPNDLDDSGVSSLYFASQKGLFGMVRVLLDGGADVNFRGHQIGSPLLVALEQGHEDVAALLLARGADPKAQGGEYGDALNAAIMFCPNAVDELLRLGADVNVQGGRYGNALQTAAVKGDEAIVDKLLARECQVNAQNGEYGNALQAAVASNHKAIVGKLFARGCRVNAQGGRFGSALNAAIKQNNEVLLDMLLKRGCQLNISTDPYGTALSTAALGCSLSVVNKLLDAGADESQQGDAILQAAARPFGSWRPFGKLEEMVLLFLSLPNFTASAEEYRKWLFLSAKNDYNKIIKILIDRKDFTPAADDYSKAFRIAGYHCRGRSFGTLLAGKPDLIENILPTIIDRGLRIRHCAICNLTTIRKRRTCVTNCACFLNVEMVLSQPGVLARVSNETLAYCLHRAARFGYPETLKVLLNRSGLNVQTSSKHGNALFAAVSSGSEESVRILLAAGSDVNATEEGNTVLMNAILSGCTENMVKLLLTAGAEVNAQILSGKDRFLISELGPNLAIPYFGNALQAAAYMGCESTVRQLLAAGATVNIQGGWAGNALQAAAYCLNGNRRENDDKLVELLLTTSAKVNELGGEFGTALQAACASVSSTVTEAIIKKLLAAGADVNITAGRYGSALQAASCTQSKAIVAMLLAEGADVNAKGGMYGTALQAAAAESSHEKVELLLSAGADVNFIGGIYGTALHAAVAVSSYTIVERLLRAGAEVNGVGRDFSEPLQTALKDNNDGITELLFAAGAAIRGHGGKYGSALQAASFGLRTEAVQFLLAKGVEVNAKGGKYGPALTAAASRPSASETIKLLIDAGAHIDAEHPFHGTALQVAAEKGNHENVVVLLAAGADVNVVGGKHGTALQAANPHGEVIMLETILQAGADVNAQGGKHGSALKRACYQAKDDKVRILINAGADVNALGGRYGTAMRAVKMRYQHSPDRPNIQIVRECKAIVDLLLASGAEVTSDVRHFVNQMQAWDYESRKDLPDYDWEPEVSDEGDFWAGDEEDRIPFSPFAY